MTDKFASNLASVVNRFWPVKIVDPDSPIMASTNTPNKFDVPIEGTSGPQKYEPKPWKEASSLIIAARVDPVEKSGLGSEMNGSEKRSFQKVLPLDDCDYRLLMAKRSGKSSFLANAFVFPGGYVELADFSPKWWSVFENAGMSRSELSSFGSHISKPRPPIMTEPGVLMAEEYLSNDIIPPDVALRITAIRETFEETGILLLNRAPSMNGNKTAAFLAEDVFAKVNINEWKKKIHDNPIEFVDFCSEVGLCPDIWSLSEWWNWLTPPALGHKRFDTMFYICCLDFLPKADSDDKEMASVEWVSPLEMLEEHHHKRASLAPPQVYELSRICNFNTLKALKDFSRHRESFGIAQWCATITGLKDGAMLSLPGDDHYNKDSEVKHLPTLDEIRSKSANLNRIELRAPIMRAVCNINLSHGHTSPITYPPLESGTVTTGLRSNL